MAQINHNDGIAAELDLPHKPAALDAKILRKSWLNWAMHNITVASYDRMEGHGFVKSLMPAVEKLYPDDKARQSAVLMPHTAYFNTEPQLGAMIPGIVLGMEEQRALGEPIDTNTIQSVKNSLMGPWQVLVTPRFRGL
jgi:mannose/fructose/N-acetylgalactosamine-specific phosphotransferase system component IID